MHWESHTFSKDSDEPYWKYEGLIQSKILLRVLNALENSTIPWQTQIDVPFTKTSSKDERRERDTCMNHHLSQRTKERQNLSKRLKVRQMCVDDKCKLEKTPNTN